MHSFNKITNDNGGWNPTKQLLLSQQFYWTVESEVGYITNACKNMSEIFLKLNYENKVLI